MTDDKFLSAWREACAENQEAWYRVGEQPNDPEGIKQGALADQAAISVLRERFVPRVEGVEPVAWMHEHERGERLLECGRPVLSTKPMVPTAAELGWTETPLYPESALASLQARVDGLTQERDFHRESVDLANDQIASLQDELERARELAKANNYLAKMYIVKGLTKAQREAVPMLSADWRAGPSLPDSLLPELKALRELGLVEREFGDVGKPELSMSDAGFRARMSACWWFRLTPLGLQLRAYLEQNP